MFGGSVSVCLWRIGTCTCRRSANVLPQKRPCPCVRVSHVCCMFQNTSVVSEQAAVTPAAAATERSYDKFKKFHFGAQFFFACCLTGAHPLGDTDQTSCPPVCPLPRALCIPRTMLYFHNGALRRPRTGLGQFTWITALNHPLDFQSKPGAQLAVAFTFQLVGQCLYLAWQKALYSNNVIIPCPLPLPCVSSRCSAHVATGTEKNRFYGFFTMEE